MAEMTVKMALELPVLRRGLPEVVAGAGKLDRPIRWVHAGEVPEIASLLRGGELLLSTGMGIGGPERQRRFVAELASRGLAGLVIELGGTFVGELPRALVEAAAEHELPLIELRAPVRFVAVTEAIHIELVNRDYSLLTRAEQLGHELTAAMLADEGVPAVLALLAERLGNPVFLETHDGRLLGHAGPDGSAEEDLVGTWTAVRDGADAAGASAPVPSGRGEGDGRLVALPLAAPFDPFTELALRRAAEMVALGLLRSRQEDELLARGRGDLIAGLADGRIGPGVAAARAAEMGFGDRGGLLVPIAARRRDSGTERAGVPDEREPAGRSWTGSLRDLDRELAGVGVPTLVGVHPGEGDLIVLAGARNEKEAGTTVPRLADALREASRRTVGDVAIAVGEPSGWERIGERLRDAIEAVAVAVDLPAAPWHEARMMPLERLLWRLGDNPDLRRFVDRVLGPLIAHDEGSRRKLLPTLEALSANGGRKAATARSLTLNRQALYARIERIERILDVDLSEAEALASIDLALRARRRLGVGRSG